MFAASESGAASSEFVIVLATAIALSLLVTAKVGIATGAMALSAGREMAQADRAAGPIVVAGGCAVEVDGARTGGGSRASIKSC